MNDDEYIKFFAEPQKCSGCGEINRIFHTMIAPIWKINTKREIFIVGVSRYNKCVECFADEQDKKWSPDEDE